MLVLTAAQGLLDGVGTTDIIPSSQPAVGGPAALAVTSMEGGSADLPCDIAAKENDSVYLVLWYRQDSGTPIYR
jgi:hypothetical protein